MHRLIRIRSAMWKRTGRERRSAIRSKWHRCVPCWMVSASETELVVGSVKTNIGHLESAAGIAGLIKTVLALQHEAIPPHLHLKEINPYLSLEDSRLEIGTYLRPWKRREQPRLAGVSSFGFGGTNAHLIRFGSSASQSAPSLHANQLERPRHLLTLSAKTESALQELARADKRSLAIDGCAARRSCLHGQYRTFPLRTSSRHSGRLVRKSWQRNWRISFRAREVPMLAHWSHAARNPSEDRFPVHRAGLAISWHGTPALRDPAGLPRGSRSVR